MTIRRIRRRKIDTPFADAVEREVERRIEDALEHVRVQHAKQIVEQRDQIIDLRAEIQELKLRLEKQKEASNLYRAVKRKAAFPNKAITDEPWDDYDDGEAWVERVTIASQKSRTRRRRRSD